MKKFKTFLIIFASLLIILLVLFCIFLFFQPKAVAKQTVAPIENISFSGNPNFVIRAELATTPAEWTRGLMFRAAMPDDAGMLFVFPGENYQSFWMKNTKIPLDMIFISSSGKIIDIKNDFLPCEKDPCPSYTSAAPAQYVLEINAGLVQKEGIKIGDSVMIRR
jgi:uncharacterized membrane protein (UPF0127 family)